MSTQGVCPSGLKDVAEAHRGMDFFAIEVMAEVFCKLVNVDAARLSVIRPNVAAFVVLCAF